ncbi:hypothetical protein KSP35_13200 [Aquihabitans sp. G128]|uniref:hypothetical protein n=1 Tax=Aquihabitans sp. G128 TaxID=2849779 RepID=UPI001C222697|nr:hypothetical protein [Aquihabitans sp. G128]QXC59360.1 hypothetical protein KSP35_13200 [Aquihabitans sp. G128]
MQNGTIGFHLDDGERPEAHAHHHDREGSGYVLVGNLAFHGRFEDLAATLTNALTAVSGLMVDDLLAAFDQPVMEDEPTGDNLCTTCGGNGCEHGCGRCQHKHDGPDSHRVCRTCGGTGAKPDAEAVAP